jgi:hypothetical protein
MICRKPLPFNVRPSSSSGRSVRRPTDGKPSDGTKTRQGPPRRVFGRSGQTGQTVGSDGRTKGRNDGQVGRTDERTERRSGRTDGRKARVGRTRAMFHLLLELSGVRHAFERHQKKVFVELLIGVFVDRPSLFVGIADLDRAIGQFESRDGVALIERRPGDE